ncbi:hypothetical protein OCU04_012955 [Sclerotinia nivalis]|uniref:Uncharacterized protein n=1 Tax=Sclerotinia nivalis TaxID=352851 RepID=A0A9X0DC90_9HELO|nr:hypothetical protein OCU04_012955 [Sclerotinia nivalis]
MDVEKFLNGKSLLSDNEIREKLFSWLQDKLSAFLFCHADTLSLHRAWDYKIELISRKEPLYFKNRSLFFFELEVVRKWIDDNLAKGFIRESRSRSAASLLLAAKPNGGVRIC